MGFEINVHKVAEASEYDHVTYIASPVETAWEQAEQVLQDKSRTDAYKKQEIDRMFAQALADAESRAESELTTLDLKEKAARKAQFGGFAPSAADAPVLLYTAQALQARAANMTSDELKAFWEGALHSGDKLTLRVLADMGLDYAVRIMKRDKPKIARGTEGVRTAPDYRRVAASVFKELIDKTTDALMTDDQRKAAETLKFVEAGRRQVGMTRSALKVQVKGWSVTPEGKIMDGARSSSFQRLRSSF